MLLEVKNITKSFGAETVLQKASLSVEKGERVGLIGANGAGKTTLLRIISGEEACDSGEVLRARDTTIGYLRQSGGLSEKGTVWEELMEVFADVTALEGELRSLEQQIAASPEDTALQTLYARRTEDFERREGFSVRAKVASVLHGMGFSEEMHDTPARVLSGGEKTKLAMAKLLLEQPDLLLLDEPTNHLDFQVMTWLEDYLKRYTGSLLIVTHDRYFLDAVTNVIYETENGGCTRYNGNYAAFSRIKAERITRLTKEYEAQQKEIKKLETYVEKNIVRASTSQMAKSRRKMLERMEIIDRPPGMAPVCRFSFEADRPSHKEVLAAEDLSVTFEQKPLFSKVSFTVRRGDRIGLIGANGIGKTSLLRALLGELPCGGRAEWGGNTDLSYYDQQQSSLHEGKTALDEVWDRFPSLTETELRTMLGCLLFSGDDVYKPVSALSGGERARLLMLCLMLSGGNVLLLDEPTNHLDLATREALEEALLAYDGTILFISHDRYFLNRISTRILELTPEGIRESEGNYDAYLAGRSTVAERTPKKESAHALSYEEKKRRQSRLRSLEKKLAAAEEAITLTEEEIAELEAGLDSVAQNYEELQKRYREIEDKKLLLEEHYRKWEELSEEHREAESEVIEDA